jgi:hypothetical protein
MVCAAQSAPVDPSAQVPAAAVVPGLMTAAIPTPIVPAAAAASWALVPQGAEFGDPTLAAHSTALALPGANAAAMLSATLTMATTLAPSSTSLWAKQLSAAQQVGFVCMHSFMQDKNHLPLTVSLMIFLAGCLPNQGQSTHLIPEIQAVMMQNPGLAAMMIPNAKFKGESKSATVLCVCPGPQLWLDHV